MHKSIVFCSACVVVKKVYVDYLIFWWVSFLLLFEAKIALLLTKLTSAFDIETSSIEYCQNKWKGSNFYTAYEKYHRYLCQLSTTIAIG